MHFDLLRSNHWKAMAVNCKVEYNCLIAGVIRFRGCTKDRIEVFDENENFSFLIEVPKQAINQQTFVVYSNLELRIYESSIDRTTKSLWQAGL